MASLAWACGSLLALLGIGMEDLRAAAPPQLIRGLVLALPFELLLWGLLVWVGWLALS